MVAEQLRRAEHGVAGRPCVHGAPHSVSSQGPNDTGLIGTGSEGLERFRRIPGGLDGADHHDVRTRPAEVFRSRRAERPCADDHDLRMLKAP